MDTEQMDKKIYADDTDAGNSKANTDIKSCANCRYFFTTSAAWPTEFPCDTCARLSHWKAMFIDDKKDNIPVGADVTYEEPEDVKATQERIQAVTTEVLLQDPVNHPAHYTQHPSGVECIQITEHMNFNLGNALKYIWRADLKANKVEDIKKAIWYLKRELQKINKED